MGVCVIDLVGDSDDVVVTVVSDKKDKEDDNERKKTPVSAPQLEIVPIKRDPVQRPRPRRRSKEDAASN